MGPGSVEYLLHGCDASPEAEAEGPDQERHGGAAYLEQGIAHGEPKGVWLGSGMAGLGLSMRAGDTAQAEDVRAIFGQLRYPEHEVPGSTEKTPVYLGSAPRKYRTAAQIVADALKKEPEAPAERRAEIERTAQKAARTTHAWYDVTLSPVKSVSVYYAALLAAGDDAGAEMVRQSHFDAIRIAVESVESDLAYVRTGRHEGKGPGGRSIGTYEQASGLSVAVFEHHTNRDGEPQLHAHAAVLGRAANVDGSIYAIDGYGFKTITDRLTAAYTRAYQQLLTERMDVVWEQRQDGKAREIKGIDPGLLAEASTRTTDHVRPRVAELVEAYEARHGRAPTGVARRALVQQAVKDTRAPKTGLAGPAAVRAWAADRFGSAAGRAQRLEAALDAVDQAVIDAAMSGTHPNRSGPAAGQQLAADGRQTAIDVLAEIAAGQAVDEGAVSGHPMPGHAMSGHRVSGQEDRSQDGRPVTVAGRVEAAITDGVADVQTKYATWSAANLTRSIDDRLGDAAAALGVAADQRPAFLHTVTEAVLAQPGRYGIAQVSAGDPVPVPDELRRASDGRSKYRPHSDERYATTAHISAEQRLLAGVQTPGGARLDEAALGGVQYRLVSQGLSADQASVVVAVLGSGRAADVLVGPAGTGKSHTIGALGREWRAGIGGRVIGVTTAEIAARNLGGLGLEAYNTTRFKQLFEPDTRTGEVADRLGGRDLVVLDEAGMSATGEMLAVAAIAEQAGAKVLYAGDHHQLQAVGAGGMFAHLATQSGALELDTVHRFEHPWEAEASLQLRAGDTAAASAYVDHGRVRTGTLEEMQAHAVRGHVADLLDGTNALLIVGTNALAADLSKQVHDQLVDFGRVDGQVLRELPDETEIGVGDRILATHNDRRLRVDPGPDGQLRPVTNKQVYEVVGRDRDGQLLARDDHGALAHLPPEYVDEHVVLAYAVTGHAAEGVTVHGNGRHLAGRDATREEVYLGLTRATSENLLYLVTENQPDPHDPQRIEDTPVQRLAEVISRSAMDQAAVAAIDEAALEEQSMGMLGALINQVSLEYAHAHNAAVIDELLAHRLGADDAAAVRGEGAYGRLLATVYAAELDGHDPAALLTEAVGMRELDSARAVSEVMHWRVGIRVANRTPERASAERAEGLDWTGLAKHMPAGPVRDYLAGLTERAVERQTELGAQAAADPPRWSRERLPEIPDTELDPEGRAAWEQRAGVVAAYREYRGIPDEQTSLGEAPPEAQQFARALWMAAAEQLHDDPTSLAWRHRSDTELYQAREAWARALHQADEHGPRAVAEDLAATHRLAAEIRDDATLAAAEAALQPADTAEHVERADAAARYTQLAEQYESDAGRLETAHTERQQWWEQTTSLREADQAAAVELARRDLPAHRGIDQLQPGAEQLELLHLTDPRRSPSPTAEASDQRATPRPGADVLREHEPSTVMEPEPTAELGSVSGAPAAQEAQPEPQAERAAGSVTDASEQTAQNSSEQTLRRTDVTIRELRESSREARAEHARQQPVASGQQPETTDKPGYTERAAADQRELEAERRGQQIEPVSGREHTPGIDYAQDTEHGQDGLGYDEYGEDHDHGEDYWDGY